MSGELTPTQKAVLEALFDETAPISSKRVAHLGGINSGRMNHLGAISACQALERKGYVKVSYASSDATYMWAITDAGRSAVQRGS